MHLTSYDLLRTSAAIANRAEVPDDTISMLLMYLLCWRDWIALKRPMSGQGSAGKVVNSGHVYGRQGANRRRAWDPCRSPVEAWIMPLPPSMRSNLSENSCALK